MRHLALLHSVACAFFILNITVARSNVSGSLEERVINFEENSTTSVNAANDEETVKDPQNFIAVASIIPTDVLDGDLSEGAAYYISVEDDQLSVINVNNSFESVAYPVDKCTVGADILVEDERLIPIVSDSDGEQLIYPVNSKVKISNKEDENILISTDSGNSTLYVLQDMANVGNDTRSENPTMDKISVTLAEDLTKYEKDYVPVVKEQSTVISHNHGSEHRIVTRDVKSGKLHEQLLNPKGFKISSSAEEHSTMLTMDDGSEIVNSLSIWQELNGNDFSAMGRCLKAMINISLECHINCNDTKDFRNTLRRFAYCFYNFAGLCKGGIYCGDYFIPMEVAVAPWITETSTESDILKKNALTHDNINCLTRYLVMSMHEGNVGICRSLQKCGLGNAPDCELQLGKPFSVLEKSCVWPDDGFAACPVKQRHFHWYRITAQICLGLVLSICLLYACFQLYKYCTQRRRRVSSSGMRASHSRSSSNMVQYSDSIIDIDASETIPIEMPLKNLDKNPGSNIDLRATTARVESADDSALPGVGVYQDELFSFPKLPSVVHSIETLEHINSFSTEDAGYESLRSYVSIESLTAKCHKPVYDDIGNLGSMSTQRMLADKTFMGPPPMRTSSQKNILNQNWE